MLKIPSRDYYEYQQEKGVLVSNPYMMDRSENRYPVFVPLEKNLKVTTPTVMADSPFGLEYPSLEFDQTHRDEGIQGLNVYAPAGVIGAEDFCIEFWFKSYTSENAYLLSFKSKIENKFSGYLVTLSSDNARNCERFKFHHFDGDLVGERDSSDVRGFARWRHWALVRRKGMVYIYCDGQQVGKFPFTEKMVSSNPSYVDFLRVGFDCAGNSDYLTYSTKFRLCNLRITKENPVYTWSFTPAKRPVGLVAGTQLLIC